MVLEIFDYVIMALIISGVAGLYIYAICLATKDALSKKKKDDNIVKEIQE